MLQTNATSGALSLDASTMLETGQTSAAPEHVDPLLWKLASPAERESLSQSGQPAPTAESPRGVSGDAPILPKSQPTLVASARTEAGPAASTAAAPQRSTVSSADQALIVKTTDQFRARFSSAAQDPAKFNDMLTKSFGDKYDAKAAEGLRQQALQNDFSWMPKIEVVSEAQLADVSGTQAEGAGKGAYSKTDDTIFLSREMLASDPVQAERILCEEMGHAIDARINTQDAVGDEGDIFSALLHGDKVTDAELQTMRADNDHGTVNINGKSVDVEYGWLKKIGKKISGAVKSVVNVVKDTAKSAVKVAVGIATFDTDKVKEGFKDGVKAVKTFAKDTVNMVKEAWKDLKEDFKKVMQSKVFAAILTVARFIPIPIVQLVVRVVDLVRAAYTVYQGVKNKSFGAVLSGVAGVAGGVGNFAGSLGASASTVQTIKTVAETAKNASMIYNAAASKNFGQAALLTAGALGAPAGVTSTLQTAVTVNNVVQAARNNDYAGALSGVANLAGGQAGQALGVSAETATTLKEVAGAVKGIDTAYKAVNNNDYAGAAAALANGFNASPEVKAVVNTAQGIQGAVKAIEKGNYAAAIAAGATLFPTDEAAKKSTGNSTFDALKNFAGTAGAIYKAVDGNEYGKAGLLAAETLGLSQDVKDKLKTLQDAEGAVKLFEKNDYAGGMAGVTELLGKDENGQPRISPETQRTWASLIGSADNIKAKQYSEAVLQVADVLNLPPAVVDSLNTSKQVEKVVQAVRNNDPRAAGAAITELVDPNNELGRTPQMVTPQTARQAQTQALSSAWAQYAATQAAR